MSLRIAPGLNHPTPAFPVPGGNELNVAKPGGDAVWSAKSLSNGGESGAADRGLCELVQLTQKVARRRYARIIGAS